MNTNPLHVRGGCWLRNGWWNVRIASRERRRDHRNQWETFQTILWCVHLSDRLYARMSELILFYWILYYLIWSYSISSSSYYFYSGMSSGIAMDKHVGGVAEYRSSEGKAVTLPYRGLIKDTVNDILGGIRSSCTYVGARYVRRHW